jgi:hypothetical protein
LVKWLNPERALMGAWMFLWISINKSHTQTNILWSTNNLKIYSLQLNFKQFFSHFRVHPQYPHINNCRLLWVLTEIILSWGVQDL